MQIVIKFNLRIIGLGRIMQALEVRGSLHVHFCPDTMPSIYYGTGIAENEYPLSRFNKTHLLCY